jgi:hypothetical protein
MEEMKVWVPAVPMPYFGFRKLCVRCSRKFWKYEDYERHYVTDHIAQEFDIHYECLQEIPVSTAIDLGYGPWLQRKQAHERRAQLQIERRNQRRLDRYW